MYYNVAQLPYNLPASGLWYSYQTQAMANILPRWMEFRDNPESVGQQFLTPMGLDTSRMLGNIRLSHSNKYLMTADLSEPDLVHKVYISRDSTLDINDLSVQTVSEQPIYEVDRVEDLFMSLPTRVELTGQTAPPSDLIYNDVVNDPSYRIVEKWEPDGTTPYNEVRPILWNVESNAIQKIDGINTAEIYQNYPLAASASDYDETSSLIDLAWMKEYLWVLAEASGQYTVSAVNRYTEMPDPGYLSVEANLALPSSSAAPVAIDNDASGYLWIKYDDDTFNQIKLCNDYYYVDRNTWIVYMPEPYSDGLIIT